MAQQSEINGVRIKIIEGINQIQWYCSITKLDYIQYVEISYKEKSAVFYSNIIFVVKGDEIPMPGTVEVQQLLCSERDVSLVYHAKSSSKLVQDCYRIATTHALPIMKCMLDHKIDIQKSAIDVTYPGFDECFVKITNDKFQQYFTSIKSTLSEKYNINVVDELPMAGAIEELSALDA